MWRTYWKFVSGRMLFVVEFVVKEFGGTKYLSMRKQVSIIEKIANIGNVMDCDESDLDQGGVLTNARIVGVLKFFSKKVCIRCEGYVKPGVGSPPIHGRCLACNVAQRYDNCATRLFAKLIFTASGGKNSTLSAPGQILCKLVQEESNDAVEELALLSVPPLKSVSFNAQDVIIGFEFMMESEIGGGGMAVVNRETPV